MAQVSMPPEFTRRVGANVTANGVAAAGQHTPVDATAGTVTLTLPSGPRYGASLSVEKIDPSTNSVTVNGNIRGNTSGSVSLMAQYETLELRAASDGSWRPIANHLPKGYVTAQIAVEAARAQAAEQALTASIAAGLLTDLPEWQANVAYLSQTLVVNPVGQIVQAPANVPARATYTAGDWTILSLTVATVAAMIAAQAVTDSTTYPTLNTGGRLAIGGTVLTPAAIGVTTGIALDTDGVPYYSATGSTGIALDTDGVPYIAD